MRVRENGDRILIELTGIAGRQQSVLSALSACRQGTAEDDGMATAEVLVRANANDMRISLRARPGLRVEPSLIYRCLREALFAGHAGAGPTVRAVEPCGASSPIANAAA